MGNTGYIVKFYKNSLTNKVYLIDYLNNLSVQVRSKILKYIEFLRQSDGYLDEPYSRHIVDKIRELRVDFGRERYRIFYFTFIGKRIILLHGFLKTTDKTPQSEINKALKHYQDVVNNPQLYD